MPDRELHPPFVLHTDVRMTRRKRYHFIIDATGEIVWSARLFEEALDWLHHNDVEEFLVKTQDRSYRVSASPAQPPQD